MVATSRYNDENLRNQSHNDRFAQFKNSSTTRTDKLKIPRLFRNTLFGMKSFDENLFQARERLANTFSIPESIAGTTQPSCQDISSQVSKAIDTSFPTRSGAGTRNKDVPVEVPNLSGIVTSPSSGSEITPPSYIGSVLQKIQGDVLCSLQCGPMCTVTIQSTPSHEEDDNSIESERDSDATPIRKTHGSNKKNSLDGDSMSTELDQDSMSTELSTKLTQDSMSTELTRDSMSTELDQDSLSTDFNQDDDSDVSASPSKENNENSSKKSNKFNNAIRKFQKNRRKKSEPEVKEVKPPTHNADRTVIDNDDIVLFRTPSTISTKSQRTNEVISVGLNKLARINDARQRTSRSSFSKDARSVRSDSIAGQSRNGDSVTSTVSRKTFKIWKGQGGNLKNLRRYKSQRLRLMKQGGSV